MKVKVKNTELGLCFIAEASPKNISFLNSFFDTVQAEIERISNEIEINESTWLKRAYEYLLKNQKMLSQICDVNEENRAVESFHNFLNENVEIELGQSLTTLIINRLEDEQKVLTEAIDRINLILTIVDSELFDTVIQIIRKSESEEICAKLLAVKLQISETQSAYFVKDFQINHTSGEGKRSLSVQLDRLTAFLNYIDYLNSLI